MDGLEGMARAAYNAYGEERNWKTFGGIKMPTWDEQDPGLKVAWMKAIQGAIHYLIAAAGQGIDLINKELDS